jgi:lysophospholipase L1-like esterase
MIKTKLRCAFALSLLIVCSGWSPAFAQARVVAFGTSFTNGLGVARSQTYPAQLQALLKSAGYNVVVDNAGVDGGTTAEGLSRLDRDVPADSRVAILEFGVNEYCVNCTGRKFTESERAAVVPNIRAMVDRLSARGVKVILVPIRHVPMGAAANGKAQVVSLASDHLSDPEFSLGDSQGHLNGAGYSVVAARLLPVVERLLGKK